MIKIKNWHIFNSQFNEDFIKNYNAENDEGYFPEVDVQYLQKLHTLHNDLPFSPERMKIEKVKTLLANLQDKAEYVTYSHNKVKASMKSWVSFKKHR